MSVNDQVTFVNGQLLLSNYNTTVSNNAGFGNGTMNVSNESLFISNLSSSNEPQKRDFVFDRTDVRVLFITLYSLVFCCCFFGEYTIYYNEDIDVIFFEINFIFRFSILNFKTKFTFRHATKKINFPLDVSTFKMASMFHVNKVPITFSKPN